MTANSYVTSCVSTIDASIHITDQITFIVHTGAPVRDGAPLNRLTASTETRAELVALRFSGWAAIVSVEVTMKKS